LTIVRDAGTSKQYVSVHTSRWKDHTYHSWCK
jgi:hypothetical protein